MKTSAEILHKDPEDPGMDALEIMEIMVTPCLCLNHHLVPQGQPFSKMDVSIG